MQASVFQLSGFPAQPSAFSTNSSRRATEALWVELGISRSALRAQVIGRLRRANHGVFDWGPSALSGFVASCEFAFMVERRVRAWVLGANGASPKIRGDWRDSRACVFHGRREPNNQEAAGHFLWRFKLVSVSAACRTASIKGESG